MSDWLYRLLSFATVLITSGQKGFRYFGGIFTSKFHITSVYALRRYREADRELEGTALQLTSPPCEVEKRRISPQGSIKVAHNCSSPWQILLSEVPLMWKPASQLQCWAWFTWAQRGLRLNAGSFMTLHSGGATKGN